MADIQTFADIQSWGIGEQLLSPLFSENRLRPQRIATFGEVTSKHGVDIEAVDDCKPHWASKASMRIDGAPVEFVQDFNWKRTRVAKSIGVVSFPSANLKGTLISGGLFFKSQFRKEIDWIGMFADWCSVLSPYGAILHPAIDLDRPERTDKDVREYSVDEEIAQNAWSRFATGTFHCEFRVGELNSLVSGLTNMGWATLFGKNFVEEVDEAAIVAAGFPIQRIGDAYLVLVTDDINDVVNDFAMFSRRRAELKSLFKDGLFLINEEPIVA